MGYSSHKSYYNIGELFHVHESRRQAIGTHSRQSTEPQAARQGLGRTGERLAAEELIRQGYRVLERNFRCTYGEIDLIAEEGDELVFVEVKTRRGVAYGLPEEAVTIRKQQKLVQVATHYLDVRQCADRAWRIDVVAVQMSTQGKLEEIRVHRYAVTA